MNYSTAYRFDSPRFQQSDLQDSYVIFDYRNVKSLIDRQVHIALRLFVFIAPPTSLKPSVVDFATDYDVFAPDRRNGQAPPFNEKCMMIS